MPARPPASQDTAAAAQPMWKRQWAIQIISHRFTFPHSQQHRWQLATINYFRLASCVLHVSGSVSDLFTLSPDPDPDPRYYLKLPGINIKVFYYLTIFASTQSRKWLRQPALGGWIKRSNCIYIFSSSSITFQHGMFRKLRSSEIPLKDIML